MLYKDVHFSYWWMNIVPFYDPETIHFAKVHSIIIFCLPPDATHEAQPLDVSLFDPLKRHWRLLSVNSRKGNYKIQFLNVVFKGLAQDYYTRKHFFWF